MIFFSFVKEAVGYSLYACVQHILQLNSHAYALIGCSTNAECHCHNDWSLSRNSIVLWFYIDKKNNGQGKRPLTTDHLLLTSQSSVHIIGVAVCAYYKLWNIRFLADSNANVELFQPHTPCHLIFVQYSETNLFSNCDTKKRFVLVLYLKKPPPRLLCWALHYCNVVNNFVKVF